jgi:hypothetical protein
MARQTVRERGRRRALANERDEMRRRDMTEAIRPMVRFPLAAAVALLAASAVPGFAQVTPPPPILFLSVNCTAGEKVGAALARAAWTFTPLVITITGVCAERVVVKRDDITLQGAAPGAGLTSPATGSGVLLRLQGARRTSLNQLTLTPTRDPVAIGLYGSAQAGITNLIIDAEHATGLLVIEGSAAVMAGGEIRNGAVSSQIQVEGGNLELRGTRLENGVSGITVANAGSALIEQVTIHGRGGTGITVINNASAYLSQVEVTGNFNAVRVHAGGAIETTSGVRIAENESDGIFAAEGAKVALHGGAVIENNYEGVRAEGGSVVVTGNVVIRNNRGSGISLGDTSVVRPGTAAITGNAGWGIFCAPSPAVAQVTPFGYPLTAFADNALGATNCPPLGLVDRLP